MRSLVVLFLLALLGACGKPAAPAPPSAPAPPPPPPRAPKPEPELPPEIARQIGQAADALPRNSGIAGIDELRNKLKAKAGPAAAPSGPPSKVDRPRPPADPPGPRLLLAVNDAEAADVPAGWPLILEAVVTDAGAPVRLALPDGWSPVASGERVWTLLPAELDRLPRGTVRIGATLEGATPRDCVVRLLPARGRLNEVEDIRRAQLLVRILLLRGDRDAAAREASELVKRRPGAPAAYDLQADALLALGKDSDAEASRRHARELAARRPAPPHPARIPPPAKDAY